MKRNRYPLGWNAERVRRVLDHYEAQTQADAVAEDEAAFTSGRRAVVEVPVELVPVIRGLISLISDKGKHLPASKKATGRIERAIEAKGKK
ncbi:MAG TPA: hypothetical protein VIK33_20760 [Anaerolineae bacterium]